MNLTVTLTGISMADLEAFSAEAGNGKALHARMAGDAEKWIKGPEVAGKISGEQHRSASRLGGTPTGHLADAYAGIENSSSDEAALLLVPRASRLRAAFGSYVLEPKKPNGFLTIPAAAEAYGRRAREFEDLFILKTAAGRSDNRNYLLLARQNGDRLQVMYVLVKSADIREDTTLIPFDELEEVAALSAEEFIDDAIAAHLS